MFLQNAGGILNAYKDGTVVAESAAGTHGPDSIENSAWMVTCTYVGIYPARSCCMP
jgi:hypothetical protein